MRPSIALHSNRTQLRELLMRHDVQHPRIFGSVIHGDDVEGSDLDILVDPTPTTTLLRLSALQVEAEQLLGIRVDIVTPKALPAKFRDRVLAEAVRL
jgi:predicted nucleotidyltransferase